MEDGISCIMLVVVQHEETGGIQTLTNMILDEPEVIVMTCLMMFESAAPVSRLSSENYRIM